MLSWPLWLTMNLKQSWELKEYSKLLSIFQGIPSFKQGGEHWTWSSGEAADKCGAVNTSSCLSQSSTKHRCGKWVLISCSRGAYRPRNSRRRPLACSSRCLMGICDSNMGDSHWGWILLETEGKISRLVFWHILADHCWWLYTTHSSMFLNNIVLEGLEITRTCFSVFTKQVSLSSHMNSYS